MAQPIALKPKTTLMDAPAPQLGPLSQWVDWDAAKSMNHGDLPKSWWHPESVPADIKAALPSAIEVHESALAPAGPDFITANLARLSVHYPLNRTQAEWKIVFEDFVTDLAEVPADILLESIRQHRQTSRFFPCVAELLGTASTLLAKRRSMIDRMHKLAKLESHEERTAREAEEAARVAAEREADLVANPYKQVRERFYRSIPNLRWSTWTPWLKTATERHGLDVVMRWHEAMEGMNMADPLKHLQEMERLHESTQGEPQ